MLAAVAFLDAFQKVADMATNTRGGEGAWLEVGDAPGWAWKLERLGGIRARERIPGPESGPRILLPNEVGFLWREPLITRGMQAGMGER